VILEIAKTDQLDIISGDAVMLRLVGLSDSAVDLILHRRLKGQATMSSAEIGRLKNTELTEKQILERINQGMTDAQADKEASLREARAITRTRVLFERAAASRAELELLISFEKLKAEPPPAAIAENFHALLLLLTFPRYNQIVLTTPMRSYFLFAPLLATSAIFAAGCVAAASAPATLSRASGSACSSFRLQARAIRIDAEYRLKNTGNQPLSELELRLPGRRRFHF